MPGLVVPEVLIVSVAVAGPVPVIATDGVARHVGAATALPEFEVTAQVNATLPVKPPLGVTVIVEVAELP